MIKNVVFDFGNVLVRFDPMYMTSLYIDNPEDAALVAEVLFDRLYWDRLDSGTISDEEVIAESCKRLPQRLHDKTELIYNNWINNIPTLDGMEALLVKLKSKNIRLFLLSNISRGFSEKSDGIQILKYFEKCIFSAVCGHVKPNRDMFEYMLRECDISSEETLFVDDNEKNIGGAVDVGINGYLFDGNVERLENYLTEMGVL